jgi:hypothetical protein
MNTKHLQWLDNATSTEVPETFVTITHPYHPLSGQVVVLLKVRGRGPNKKLLVLADGKCRQIRSDWTDYNGKSSEPEPMTVFHLCTIEGLKQMVTILHVAARE